MQEPIRQVWQDDWRSQVVAQGLHEIYPNWFFYPTPPFYFMDYHIQHRRSNGRENYIGDLEVKWLNQPASRPVKFPFQKLQKMLMTSPYNDNAYHRICFRFNDGLLLIPAVQLGGIIPEWTTRHDTGEYDLNVIFRVENYSDYWIEKVVYDK